MLKKTLGSVLVVALLSTSAMAADLPSRSYPPVYVPPATLPVFTWTGFYVGAQVGYDSSRSHAYANAPGVGGLAAAGATGTGVIGGGHVGYNYATPTLAALGGNTHVVFGVEGDVEGTSANAGYALGGIGYTTNTNVQGSVRGRLGIAVDRALFYATGGVAFGGLNNTYTNPFNGTSDTFNHTRVGYTIGGGVEYAVTNNWSLRAEYRRTDFGKVTDPLTNTTLGGVTVKAHEIDNRAQLGVSYKFDLFSPVVARY